VVIEETKYVLPVETELGGSRPKISTVIAEPPVAAKSAKFVTVAVVPDTTHEIVCAVVVPVGGGAAVKLVTVQLEQLVEAQAPSKVTIMLPPRGTPCASVKPTVCLTLTPSVPRVLMALGVTVMLEIDPTVVVKGRVDVAAVQAALKVAAPETAEIVVDDCTPSGAMNPTIVMVDVADPSELGINILVSTLEIVSFVYTITPVYLNFGDWEEK
jgi:hypothetical protein